MSTLHTTIGCLPSGSTTLPAYDVASTQYRSVAQSANARTAPSNGAANNAQVYYSPPLAEHVAPRSSAAVVALPISTQRAAASSSAALPAEFEPREPARAWKYIVVHHSATADGDVRSIDGDHRGRVDRSGQPWLGIGYHFVIGNGGKMGDGEVEATFRWRDQLQGAHAGSRTYNEEGIGICLIGDFDRAPPTPRQLAAAQHLAAVLADRYGIPRANWKRHSDVNNTECPGKLFPWGQFIGL